jgi:hypothetical protein
MDFQSLGRILLVIGIIIAVLGLVLMLLGRTGVLNALGSLPGDIRIEGSGFTCLIPIVSSILISVVLTIILNIIIRIINRP